MYEVLLSMSLLGFGIGTMLDNCEECESRSAYVF